MAIIAFERDKSGIGFLCNDFCVSKITCIIMFSFPYRECVAVSCCVLNHQKKLSN